MKKRQRSNIIGHYKLGKTLGKGSFGKVKLGEHETIGHKVAIKIFSKEKFAKSKSTEEKIKREIKILKLFRHPHVIRLYEVIDTEREIYLIMEYVSGGELFEYIVERGRLEEREARRFFQQILSGIEYCHKHQVIHRDLKPENLLLDSNGNVKIADFGLSNVMREGTFLKSSVGSPNYAAPEVISGKHYVGPEVDVWSCGVILYALLCGKLPFDEEKIGTLFRKIRTSVYTIPNWVSNEARHLIRNILEVDPMKRYTVEQIRRHKWFRKELPYYLSLSPKINNETEEIDYKVLDMAIEKIDRHYSKEQAIKNLKERTKCKVTVAYYLLLDRKNDSKILKSDSSYPIGLDGLYLPNNNQNNKNEIKNDIIVYDSQLGDIHRENWLLGISSSFHPQDIMDILYQVLKKLSMKWKIVGSYKLHTTKIVGSSNSSDNVVIGIQLFRKLEGTCVLDIQLIEGNLFQFIGLASLLRKVLKRAFTRVAKLQHRKGYLDL